MTMLAELKRSAPRQLLCLATLTALTPRALQDIWNDGFRTRLIVVDDHVDAAGQLRDWLEANGEGPTASVVSLSVVEFATRLVTSFASAYEDEKLIVRQRDDAGTMRLVDLTDVDDPERLA